MIFQNKEIVEELKRNFPKGTRVELYRMEDTQAPPEGTKGTVQFVDDAGHIHVKWDNGSSLSLLYDVDKFAVID